ncbi:high-affinity iron permease [Marasmius crinis-equi]|uniref:High-affinity iron permease n=1 Tax=Marasmius crinis-equi TaxID=585013 RepID=A0ABR3FSE9_9AGAR
MAKNLFSVPIFFIVFRETLEAAIIVSVLLGLAEQLVNDDPGRIFQEGTSTISRSQPSQHEDGPASESAVEDDQVQRRRLIRKLRWNIFGGAFIGLLIALAIGAAFIAVWFTKASNLWAKSEELWEGIFELVASIMIFGMGLTMLKMDRAKAKWRIKLQRAFDNRVVADREGIEAIIFVGGVSLGEPATAIPIATIVGLICGFICGFLIYEFASRTTLTIFLVVMTNFLLLIGAGLFARAMASFEKNAFNHILGPHISDLSGDGPGWSVFSAIFGWTSNATLGRTIAYPLYWLCVVVALVLMKYHEGRVRLFGRESTTGYRRRIRRQEKTAAAAGASEDRKGSSVEEEEVGNRSDTRASIDVN